MNTWGTLVFGGVVAPLVLAAIVGLAKWGAAVTRALSKLTELVDDVRELTGSVRDLSDVRAELRAHIMLADDRWHSLGIPHPRVVGADGPDRRTRARAVVLGD